MMVIWYPVATGDYQADLEADGAGSSSAMPQWERLATTSRIRVQHRVDPALVEAGVSVPMITANRYISHKAASIPR